MKIEFEFKNKEYIKIIGIDKEGNRQEIGHIFTPSGSTEDSTNSIQVCGFDNAFDLWGCGVYGDSETKEMKKDIQLQWNRIYPLMDHSDRMTKFDMHKDCGKCFNNPCTCEILTRFENPYTVKREQDLSIDKKEKKK